MSDPRKPVTNARTAAATETDDPWWGVPRKMMPEVSLMIPCDPSMHKAFRILKDSQQMTYGEKTYMLNDDTA